MAGPLDEFIENTPENEQGGIPPIFGYRLKRHKRSWWKFWKINGGQDPDSLSLSEQVKWY